MTAKDLKNALLQEAVQGKLVPQIASEGNAKDLLEEIKKERGESLPLSSARKRSSATPSPRGTQTSCLPPKTPNDSPRVFEENSVSSRQRTTNARFEPISKDEIPFEIPESWCWCRLGELGAFVRGNGIKRDETTSNGYPCVRYGEMYTTYKTKFSVTKSFTTKEVFEKCHKIQKNDILMALTGENKWDIALAAVYQGEPKLALGGDLCKFTPLNVDSLFLVYIINSPFGIGQKRNTATGDIIVHISAEKLGNMLFPLPPLAEQKRIVAALEKFIPLIEEYGKKEAALKKLNANISTLTKKAILQEAVQGKLVPQLASEGNAKDLLEQIRAEKAQLVKKGKLKKEKPLPPLYDNDGQLLSEIEVPFDIPKNWCWCRLTDICNLYTGNSINETEKKLKYTNVKDGWFYIGTKDVGFDQTINYENGIKIPYENKNFRIAPKNTALMCIEGGSAGRKIAFTNCDVCFGNKLCCFNPYNSEIEKFLFYFLQSTLFTDSFKSNINGIIGGVSINNLKGMLFPIPPLAEQKRIVVAIEQLLPLCEKLGD